MQAFVDKRWDDVLPKFKAVHVINIYKLLLNFLHFAKHFAQNIAKENGTVQKMIALKHLSKAVLDILENFCTIGNSRTLHIQKLFVQVNSA